MESSKHVWQLKGEGEKFKLTWSINHKAQAYSKKTKWCKLCLTEKLNANKNDILNKRSNLSQNVDMKTMYMTTSTI